MSVQFGRWSFDGRPADPVYLKRAGEMLVPYGPDGEGTYIKDSVGMLFYAFHTTKESRRETQPHLTSSGAVLTWDGRLDNRPELIGELADVLTASATDVEIVAAAYEQWGTDCFAKLLGDWALSIWNPSNRSLVLAKDFVGTRHLYYSVDKEQVTWSTILDPLVLLAGKTFTLEEEYIAGWLSFFPATHLTPYVGIQAVPPSCFVRLTPRGQSVHKYWDFDPHKRIRYRADGEYEEHFRQVFKESVRRRLRSDSPILAELSGGMDSSSIVCMADEILARGEGETPRLDTVSYYNDSEPNWNEKPYFTKVEEKRGRVGWHINVGSVGKAKFRQDNDFLMLTPSSGARSSERAAAYTISDRNRVVLSGTGGDEVMGGVPTPAPELEDLLARGHLKTLAHQLKVWSLDKRKPWLYLLFQAAGAFFPPDFIGASKYKLAMEFLNLHFTKRNRGALRGYQARLSLFGSLPSFQESIITFNALRRQLSCSTLSSDPPREKRYPCLDRSLLEFMFAIPREQVVRPGHRRSLMRRALADVVPRELLGRKRKGYVARAPLAAIAAEWTTLVAMTQHMVSSSLKIVDSNKFSEMLVQAKRGQEVPTVLLMRTVGVEFWFRNLCEYVSPFPRSGKILHCPEQLVPNIFSAEKS